MKIKITTEAALNNYKKIADEYLFNKLINLALILESVAFGKTIAETVDTDNNFDENHGYFDFNEWQRTEAFENRLKEKDLIEFPIVMAISIVDSFIESIYNGWLIKSKLFKPIVEDFDQYCKMHDIQQSQRVSALKLKHYLRIELSGLYPEATDKGRELFNINIDYQNNLISIDKIGDDDSLLNILFNLGEKNPKTPNEIYNKHCSYRKSRNRIVHGNYFRDGENIEFSDLKNIFNNTFMLLSMIKAAPLLWWFLDETEE